MMSRCQCCADLSIHLLLEMMSSVLKSEWSNMPWNSFYRVHISMDDLETSANHGCDFCTLLLESFQITPAYRFSNASWLGEPSQYDHDDRGSMFSVLKQLPLMVLHICIHPRHISITDKWESAQVFDQIVIQPRGIPTADLANKLTGQFDCIPLILTLTSPLNEPIRVENYRIGRIRADPDLGSQANFDVAKAWLKTCREQHHTCLERDIAKLPTRIIDVGSGENPNILRIVHSNGAVGQYVILSHCWGGKVSHILNEETSEEYQLRLPFDDLPANFRDAITVTRQLGIRYLWIDSLCILQDSKPDWENESKKMGEYYRCSTLMISASASEKSTRGFLIHEQEDSNLKPVKLGVYPNSDDSHQVTVERLTHKREDLYFLSTEGPLASRGWTLQEELLSPRHLYYGRRQMYWKCLNGENSVEGVPSREGFPQFDMTLMSSIFYQGLLREVKQPPVIGMGELLSIYYKLVQMYSARKLTYDSDKLPAFSGLAQRIATALPGQYLAGLWSCEISSGLDWYNAGDARPVNKYRAPSWTWAAMNEQIHFIGCPIGVKWESKIQLLGHDMVYRDPSNTYGEVTTGHITVQGYTKPLFRSSEIDAKAGVYEVFSYRMSVGHQGVASHDIFFVDKEECDYFLVAPRNHSKKESPSDMEISNDFPEKYLVLLLRTFESIKPSATCLILREIASGKEPQFERIGSLSYYGGEFPEMGAWDNMILKLV
ncbi:heterokaryon incompatibility protein-domain-containing protein [Annulohypoxylon nitens]|nr:heterokaryon incompatibility protein-domain-containing protein [Annulohypoxylon nitens]